MYVNSFGAFSRLKILVLDGFFTATQGSNSSQKIHINAGLSWNNHAAKDSEILAQSRASIVSFSTI